MVLAAREISAAAGETKVQTRHGKRTTHRGRLSDREDASVASQASLVSECGYCYEARSEQRCSLDAASATTEMVEAGPWLPKRAQ